MSTAKPTFAGYSDVVFETNGGMGHVYRGVKDTTGKRVALKLAQDGQEAHLRREAEILGRLDHHGLVTPQHSGELDGRPFLELPWIDGKNLHTLMEGYRDSYYWMSELQRSEVVLYIGIEVFSIIAYVHGQGFVHRDVSPENVMITVDADVKLIDFGVAAEYTGAPLRTQIVKPGYAAPELEFGRGVPRSDVFSVGRTLCAFAGSDEAPPDHLEPRLRTVLARLLHRDPQQRPDVRTALQLLQGLVEPRTLEHARSVLSVSLRQRSALDHEVTSSAIATLERRARRYLFVSLGVLAMLAGVVAGVSAVRWHESHTDRASSELQSRF